MMSTWSTIQIDVLRDEDKIPEKILWAASNTTAEEKQEAQAMMLAFWDRADSNVPRIDIWAKGTFIDEIADMCYASFMSIADFYNRAANNPELTNEIKKFANEFRRMHRESENKKSNTK
jgi:gliding motility-associated protein GldC